MVKAILAGAYAHLHEFHLVFIWPHSHWRSDRRVTEQASGWHA